MHCKVTYSGRIVEQCGPEQTLKGGNTRVYGELPKKKRGIKKRKKRT